MVGLSPFGSRPGLRLIAASMATMELPEALRPAAEPSGYVRPPLHPYPTPTARGFPTRHLAGNEGRSELHFSEIASGCGDRRGARSEARDGSTLWPAAEQSGYVRLPLYPRVASTLAQSRRSLPVPPRRPRKAESGCPLCATSAPPRHRPYVGATSPNVAGAGGRSWRPPRPPHPLFRPRQRLTPNLPLHSHSRSPHPPYWQFR